MPATKEEKVLTFDKKPAFKHQLEVSIPIEWTNHATLMLHEQMVSGELGKEKFRFIKSINNRGMRLEYKGQHLTIDTRKLVETLMDKIIDLQKMQEKHL